MPGHDAAVVEEVNRLVAFRVADLEAAHRRAVEAGAEVIHGPKPRPWGLSARYRDFDGNVIELTQ
jgi:predicted enzyme related to lactoylglutathione lyase